MTPADIPSGATLHPAGMAMHAGTMLRDAREAAGLSLDAVAQQLKLAPRQVQALEDGDYALLPGRTFVRGFARNYARLLGLDSDSVLGALPGAGGASALESPTLHPTAVKIGELPSGPRGRPVWLGLALLVLIVVLAALFFGYRHYRGTASGDAPAARAPAAVREMPANPPGAATSAPPTAVPSLPTPPGATPLPNPVVSPPLDSGSAPAKSGAAGDGFRAVNASTSEGSIAPLAIATRGASWIEVRDGSGQTVLSAMVAPGRSEALVGAPPFDVVIGNAPEVTLSYRGRPVDLAPFIRQNVARLRLQ